VVSGVVWGEGYSVDIIVAEVTIYPAGDEPLFIQDIDTAKLGVISVSGANSNNIAVESGNINRGDFYVVAASSTRV
jgi:hypothetical protein